MAGRGRPKGSTNKARGVVTTQKRTRTAINWILGDAAKVLTEGADLEKVADVGKKFPILARGILTDPVGVLMALTAPAISARKVARMYEEYLGMAPVDGVEDADEDSEDVEVDMDEEEDEEEEVAPRKKAAAKRPGRPAKKAATPPTDEDDDFDDLDEDEEEEEEPAPRKKTAKKVAKKPIVEDDDDDFEDFDDDDFE